MTTREKFSLNSSMVERIMSCTYFDGITDSEVSNKSYMNWSTKQVREILQVVRLIS